MMTKVEKAKRNVESAQRAYEEEIDAAHTSYQNAVTELCEAIQPTDEEAVLVGYENNEVLADAVNDDDEALEELVKSLDEILSLREKSKAAGC
jgi:hypothetical protein